MATVIQVIIMSNDDDDDDDGLCHAHPLSSDDVTCDTASQHDTGLTVLVFAM